MRVIKMCPEILFLQDLLNQYYLPVIHFNMTLFNTTD